ncbi:MAG TPA: 2-oxo-hepta-3-ene-1,7-dioic acid hydratase [Novosphingobium sp.]|nr:2-oxo-hepta-3-ene-1,7-dioic acid hydratase [Novosphingobium sp.]
MLDESDLAAGAAALADAEANREKITQLSITYPDIRLEDAYEIQRRYIRTKVERGSRIVGHKVGLTSRVMQMNSKIDEPDYGHLTDDMHYSDGAIIPTDRFLWPRIETELAFVLGKPVKGPHANMFTVLDATDYVVPALEIIDYRTEIPRTICDTIADNAASGAFIIGGRAVRPLDIDVRWVAATLSRNGTIEESGVSAAVMGHPAMGIVWLANKLAAQGEHLEAGHIVLSGSFTRPIAVAPGDTITADYGSLGSIGVAFS